MIPKPEEKAIELVDAFMNVKPVKLSDYSRIYYPTAKQCALIAVEFAKENLINSKGYNEYLDEIKEEIIKL
jgi:hypothetical protein